jgi:hypothetical protein
MEADRRCSFILDIGYAEDLERSPMDRPFTFLASSYASPSKVLPYTSFQASSHSVHTNVGNDNHTITFNGDKHCGLVDICWVGKNSR